MLLNLGELKEIDPDYIKCILQQYENNKNDKLNLQLKKSKYKDKLYSSQKLEYFKSNPLNKITFVLKTCLPYLGQSKDYLSLLLISK